MLKESWFGAHEHALHRGKHLCSLSKYVVGLQVEPMVSSLREGWFEPAGHIPLVLIAKHNESVSHEFASDCRALAPILP
jgi:hypothetical protein